MTDASKNLKGRDDMIDRIIILQDSTSDQLNQKLDIAPGIMKYNGCNIQSVQYGGAVFHHDKETMVYSLMIYFTVLKKYRNVPSWRLLRDEIPEEELKELNRRQ